MGISFKVSKTGTRFRPRPSAAQDEGSRLSESSKQSSRVLGGAGLKREADVAEAVNGVTCISVSSTCSGGLVLPEHEVSFTLNLFQEGYFIWKPIEMENFQPLLQDGKSLHPYDRASETLFSAIESGWLPGDILDDIPSKYFDGTLVCEVRDYRKCMSKQGTSVSTADAVPVVNKVCLRMSLENVVKDIPLMSDDSWTYSDLMEVESRILKALQPRLCLDPTPMLGRLCDDPTCTKLNLGIGRKKRLRQTPEVTVASNNQTHGKKVCIGRALENASCKQDDQGTVLGCGAMQPVHENSTAQHVSGRIPSLRPNNFAQDTAKPVVPLSSQTTIRPAINYPGIVHDRGSRSPANFSGVNGNISSPQTFMGSYTETVSYNVPLHSKRENQDAQLTSIGGIKRSKQTPLGLEGIHQQQVGPQLVGLNGADMHWKNQLLHSPIDMKGIQYSTIGAQRYPPKVINSISNQETGTSFYSNQQGRRFGVKEEQVDTEKLDGQEIERSKDNTLQALSTQNNSLEQQQSGPQHLPQQPTMRNHLPPLTQWHNARPLVDKDIRTDDVIQKRKSVHSPRVSSGPMVQSPVSSKSGEISSGSVGGQFSAVATTSALGSQKDKAIANSNASIGAPSVTSSPNDSVHRQHQASVATKRKSNSFLKTQAISGVGSPASTPLNANSPSIGSVPMDDHVILERFAKIETVTQRYQLNLKKNKVDDYPAKKAVSYSSQDVSICLSNSLDSEDFTEPMKQLSRSLIGGTINTCKNRLMNFIHTDHVYQVVPSRAQYRVTMTEKPCDGTVVMQYGGPDDCPNSQDCLLMLPTTHHADLLAAQFCVLMERDGYKIIEDQIRPVPIHMGAASISLATVPGIPSDNATPEVKHPEIAPGQPSNIAAPVNNIGIEPLGSSQNFSNSTRMLASENFSNSTQISQGYLPGTAMPSRTQQLDQPLQLQMQQNLESQIQQQQQLPLPHIHRSSPLLSTNPFTHLMGQNASLQVSAKHMINNNTPTQLQIQMMQQQAQQQQQQQQQQQNQLPKKMMMGLSAMGMGNMGNNMVGLGGLGNVMGTGGVRGISSTMGPMFGLGNVSPNQMNLGAASSFGTALHPGSMSVAQAAMASKQLRMAAQQNRAGMYGPQSGITGMTGNSNQMLPNSAGLPMLGHMLNRASMSPLQRNAMLPMGPPKMAGANFYLNPQQQLQQLQQQMQQQQQISSPLQVGSPSSLVMHQQQINPQQMGQQTVMIPQQPSSGALQQINSGGSAGAGPASPQLSSQTHGSVGSITSSPMEQLHGANNALNNL